MKFPQKPCVRRHYERKLYSGSLSYLHTDMPSYFSRRRAAFNPLFLFKLQFYWKSSQYNRAKFINGGLNVTDTNNRTGANKQGNHYLKHLLDWLYTSEFNVTEVVAGGWKDVMWTLIDQAHLVKGVRLCSSILTSRWMFPLLLCIRAVGVVLHAINVTQLCFCTSTDAVSPDIWPWSLLHLKDH